MVIKHSDFPVFVVHVKGAVDRERHIESELKKHRIDRFTYILDGDVADLNPRRLADYFVGAMQIPSPVASCGFKHLLAYRAMVEQGIERALIIEDDIFFDRRFDTLFPRVLAESQQWEQPYLVVLEATCMKFVPRSMRQKGRVLYPSDQLQCAGAYVVNLAYAKAVIDYAKAHKCAEPIDWFLTRTARAGVFEVYWCYPVLAEQGSHNGQMDTMIGNGVGKRGFWVRCKRSATMQYKRLLYFFR